MILTGPGIVAAHAQGVVLIDPFTEAQVNPNSYNVRLGDRLLRYTGPVLDPYAQNETEQLEIGDGHVLQAGEFYLGHTVETIGSTAHVPMLYGRSSVGRLGLFVQITAPIGDIGFVGQWTLQLAPVRPLRVYTGMEIGQVMFVASTGPITPYTGKYQGSTGPQASQYWRGRAIPAQRRRAHDAERAA